MTDSDEPVPAPGGAGSPATITTPRRLMINTILNLGNQAITVVVNFLMVGFFLDTLGEEQYGIWILVGSIFSYRTLLSMGLNSAVNRNIPVHLARNDTDAITGVVSTAIGYYLIPSTVLAVATLIISANMEALFTIPAVLADSARAVVLIVGLSYSATIPLQVYSAVLSSYQRYDAINAVNVVSILSRTALILLLLDRDNGLLVLGVLYGGTEVVIRLFATVLGYRLMHGLRVSVRRIDRSLLASMMTYGVSTALYMSAAALIYKAGDVVIAALISPAAVSQFFIATTPILLLTTVVQVFAQAMKPAVSELDALDDQNRIREMALMAQKYALFVLLPGTTFVVAMGGAFLEVWVGDRFPDPSVRAEQALVLQILAIGAFLRLSQHTNFIVLIGMGRHRAFGWATGLMLAASVAIEVVAVVMFDAGLTGIAVGSCLPMAVVSSVFLPIYFRRRTGIGLRVALGRSWWPALIGALPGMAVVGVTAVVTRPDSWIEIGGVVVGSALATAVGAWLFALEEVERERFRRLLPF